MLHPRSCRRLPICTLVIVLGLSRWALAANPSNKDFDAGIAVHGGAEVKALAQQAQALYETSNEATIKFAEAVRENKVARLNWKPLGENDVRLDQLRRIADQLALHGETAGIDYRLRADALFRTTGDIIDAFRATEISQRQMDPVRLKLQQQAPVRDREAAKLARLAQEGKWEEAERQMYRFLDQLGVATTCLFNNEKPPIYAPFNEVKTAIDTAMRRARSTQARKLLTERRQSETPDFAGVLREAEAAAASLSTSGTVMIDGASVTGPEALTAFGQRWAEVQVKTIRCRTLDWLLANAATVYDGTNTGEQASRVVSEFADFNGRLMRSLAGMIESDAGRVTGTDAVALYVDYLQAAAPLIRRSANQALAPVLNPALQSLANRAPQFPAEIGAYAEATGDLLRWRGRVARNRAIARAEAFPSIDRLMVEATRSDADYVGLYPEQGGEPNVATLLASAPEVMPRPIERLQDQQAHALDLVRLGSDGPVAIARYRVRSYANVPAPLDLEAETDALKFDLMVDDDLPPLTMLAAVAVASAERGDLAAIGGTITNQYLESVATRFAALPAAASVLTPLGAIPQQRADVGVHDQVLMRFDLTPLWAQHDFFFAELPPPPAPATE